jgi:DNA polymerase III alpha subunit (gram-positive type)
MIAARHSAHFVQFFATDVEWVNAVADFVKEGIETGCTCVVVATQERRSGIAARLQSHGIRVAEIIATYQYVELDAPTTLEGLMDGNHCDGHKFHQAFDTLMRQASSRGEPVRIYGEMVNLLVEQDLPEAAIQIEELCNELSRHHSFSMFCGYSADALANTDQARTAAAYICAVHSDVIGLKLLRA